MNEELVQTASDLIATRGSIAGQLISISGHRLMLVPLGQCKVLEIARVEPRVTTH